MEVHVDRVCRRDDLSLVVEQLEDGVAVAVAARDVDCADHVVGVLAVGAAAHDVVEPLTSSCAGKPVPPSPVVGICASADARGEAGRSADTSRLSHGVGGAGRAAQGSHIQRLCVGCGRAAARAVCGGECH